MFATESKLLQLLVHLYSALAASTPIHSLGIFGPAVSVGTMPVPGRSPKPSQGIKD